MHNMIVYHYAFGPMKVIKEDKNYIEAEIIEKDGLAPSLKKLIIDLNTRVFHKKALGVILFENETSVKNFIKSINGGVFTLEYDEYFNQVPKCLYISRDLIHKIYFT
ncbi:TPA: hypothetical protein GXZ54_04770 [bacterium]|nr:hypothetical protein [bacterium]